jgi:hypothetical protein
MKQATSKAMDYTALYPEKYKSYGAVILFRIY